MAQAQLESARENAALLEDIRSGVSDAARERERDRERGRETEGERDQEHETEGEREGEREREREQETARKREREGVSDAAGEKTQVKELTGRWGPHPTVESIQGQFLSQSPTDATSSRLRLYGS